MKNIIQQYLRCLETGDAGQVTGLFSDNAIVHSPLYGNLPATVFFKGLFADTNRSIITLLNIFTSGDKPLVHAAHFRYDWILKNGAATSFECIDIFQFDAAHKIKELTIVYDASKIREAFASLD